MAYRPTAALREAARITRREARNFYFAFLTLPREERLGVYSLYAFFRRADDIADGSLPLGKKRKALVALRKGVSSPGGDPVLVALSWARERFGIPEELLSAAVAGVEMDLEKMRYQSFSELEKYCWHVASAVGLCVLRVLGAPREADSPGERFGIGMQLVNILRDVREDLERGRIYIPQDELAQFGVSEQDLGEGELTPGLQNLFSFQARRAQDYLGAINELLPLVPRRGRPCIGVLGALYGAILRRIEERGFDVLAGKVSLPTLRKIAIAWRAAWQSRTGAVSW